MKRRQQRVRIGRIFPGIVMASFFFVLVAPVWSAHGFTVTTTVESGSGTIKPTSPTVGSGKNKTITMKPAKGWHVAQVMVDDTTAVYDKDDRIALASVKLKKKNVKYKLRNVAADHTVKVTFEEDRSYNLGVTVVGNGTVKARPGGLTCQTGESDCSAAYTEDKTVKLTAKAAKGYLLSSWGGSASGIKKKARVVMNGHKAITATFVAKSAAASALKVAEKISVVDAKEDISEEGVAGAVAPSVPADSDYMQDETFAFVEEESVETFEIMNEILCMMAQTKYEDLLNQGNYKALIDMAQCESERDDASSADGESSQSSGSSAASKPDYEQWTVNSSRKSSAAPHIVKVWIHETGEDGGGPDSTPSLQR